MYIEFDRNNGMKRFWHLISFTKFFRNFQTNCYLFCNTRKENTVLNRLHTGHSYLTHSFILRKEEAPVCVACNAVITVKHILIECPICWRLERNISKRNLCIHSFGFVVVVVVVYFVRDIGVFYKI